LSDQRDGDDPHNHRKRPSALTLFNVIIYAIGEISEHRRAERARKNAENRLLTWTTITSVVIAAFTVVLAVATGFLYSATADMAADAKQATIEANRAWVGIYRADHGTLKTGQPMYVQLTLVNTGIEPALRGNWGFKIHAIKYIPENNGDLINKSELPRNDACDGVDLFPIGSGTSVWHTLLHDPAPGDRNDVKLGPSEIPYVSDPSAQEDINAAIARQKSLMLNTCFVYWSGGQRRHTSAQFLLRDADGVDPSQWSFNMNPSGNSAD
jgi:hypothetical protein